MKSKNLVLRGQLNETLTQKVSHTTVGDYSPVVEHWPSLCEALGQWRLARALSSPSSGPVHAKEPSMVFSRGLSRAETLLLSDFGLWKGWASFCTGMDTLLVIPFH